MHRSLQADMFGKGITGRGNLMYAGMVWDLEPVGKHKGKENW